MKLFLLILLMGVVFIAQARTVIVRQGSAISTIREGVAAAGDGDSILVYAGTYKEGNLLIKKSIRLIGIGRPVIDGERRHQILTISGSGILIKGFHFMHAGFSSMEDYAAIKVIDASELKVEDNFITETYFAIHISNARNIVVRNNRIQTTPETEQSTGNGIHLWKCEGAVIEYNNITGHRDGIYLEFVTHSIIQRNKSTGNIRYGLHFMFSHYDAYIENYFARNGAGVAVMFSKQVWMIKNHFEENWGASAYGLLLKEISASHILQNSFTRNTIGILMEGTSNINVEQNTFRENGWSMKVQASCNETLVHHNNFFSNSFDVSTNGTMMLSHFYNNYWDKYEGYDKDRNGVGDIVYHPVSMYAMVMEQVPHSVLLLRSFMVSLLDKAEKAIPSLTPEQLVDAEPLMKPLPL